MSAEHSQTEGAAGAQGSAGARPHDVLEVLAEFELGLESLKTLCAQRQELQVQLEERKADLDRREGVIAQAERLQRENEVRASELEKARGLLEADRREFDAEAERRLAEVESRRADLESRSAELGDRADRIAAQLEEIAARENALSQQHEALGAERKAAEGLRAALAAKDAELVRRDSQARALAEELSRLKSAAASEGSQARAKAEEYGRLAGEHAAKAEELSAQVASLREQLAIVEESRTTGEERIAELESLLRQEREQAATRPAAWDPPQTWVEKRKRRLAKYREAVHRQSLKVRKAGEALKKRYEQCEQVLSMRAELFSVRERVLEAERRVQKRKAGATAAVIVFCAAATVAVLGALSWAVSRQVAPAMFEATSMIGADGRGRELNEAELEEWTRFHEQLLQDPVFHSAAADRYRRQGVPELGEPAAVAGMIRERLTTEAVEEGTLTLRLRAEGSARTERDLDLLTSALASHANAEQQRRIDGGVTKVAQAAKAGAEPIDQMRNIYALAGTGGGSLIAGLMGIVAWRRLSRAKTAFEMDNHINQTLGSPKFASIS